MTEGLTGFLLARIEEDEALARDSHYEGQRWYAEEETVSRYADDETVYHADRKRDAQHIVNWMPARVLAECAAKRQIVELHADQPATYFCDAGVHDPHTGYICRVCGGIDGKPCETLHALASPFADHPDFREEWRVG